MAKYEKVNNYWVYSIQIPSINKYYIGVSKQQCSRRWQKILYEGMTLEPYLNEWQDMTKTVLVDNLTKEQAYQYEDNIIRALQMNNLCLNERRSGLIANDRNTYQRELYQNNTEYQERVKQRQRQYYEDNKEQIIQQHKQYRDNNKEQILEHKKQYYEDNKEKIIEHQKQYYEDNKEQILEYKRQYYEKNKEKKREYNKQYYLKKKLEREQQTSVH